MDSPGEILRLCRLCLVKDCVNIPIFEEEGDARQIFLKISSCLPVKVSREDRLPKKICDGCSEKLNSFYEFWSSSADAEKTLLSWVGQEEEEAEKKTEPSVPKPLAALVKEESEVADESHAQLVEEEEESTKDEEVEAPPAKRARRSAAVRAQKNITLESEDDDLDTGEPLTKMEEESADSDGEDKDPSYVEVPGTSADDEQAGPSGVGKDAVEAPFTEMNLFQKAAFLKTHFSKECKIILVDFMKTKNGRRRWSKLAQKPLPDNLTRKRYTCYICFEKFATNEELKGHKKEHQAEEEEEEESKMLAEVEAESPKDSDYKCITCDANFKDQLEVKAHVHTQYTCKYFCKRCGRFFNTKGGFIVHLIQHSMDNTVKLSYRCEKCSSTFDDCYKLKRHYVTAHNTFTYSRVKPKDKEAPTTKSMSDPSNPITGSIPIFDCDVCYDVFASQKALVRHKALHRSLEKTINIEDDDTSPQPTFNKLETTQQITQMLGAPKPSTSSSVIYTDSVKPNSTPTPPQPPILLNPTLPSHSVQQSMVALDPSKTYYVVLPGANDAKTPQPVIPTSMIPKLTKIKPNKKDDFVMPVITSFGTVTEDIQSKKRGTDPTTQYETEYAKFLNDNRQKKLFKIVLSSPKASEQETITIDDSEPTVGPSYSTKPMISVKKFAQLKETSETDDIASDSTVHCAFCGLTLKDSAAYRKHHASHHV